jgi:hypothetical protein
MHFYVHSYLHEIYSCKKWVLQKCSRWLALLIREETLGLLECLVLEVLKNWLCHNVTYHEANTCNQSVKCNKHELNECIE